MPAEIVNLQKSMRLPRKAIREAVDLVAREELERDVLVSLAFVTDRHMARVNEQWLRHHGPTDVISFPLAEKHAGPDDVFGELVISTDRALDEARKRGLSSRRELLLYVVHGMLHLAGFDDLKARDAKRMHRREEEILRALGEANPRSNRP